MNRRLHPSNPFNPMECEWCRRHLVDTPVCDGVVDEAGRWFCCEECQDDWAMDRHLTRSVEAALLILALAITGAVVYLAVVYGARP